MESCRRPRCRAPVFWIAHENTGKVAPIDPEPVVGGNVEIIIQRDEQRDIPIGMTYRIVPKEERGGRLLHRNHYVTCEDPPPKTRRLKDESS